MLVQLHKPQHAIRGPGGRDRPVFRLLRFAGIVGVAFLVCLARSVHPSQRFSFWAEDGLIFTSQVRAGGIAHSFVTSYSGYYLFLPRAVAAFATILPLEWSPPIYAVGAMLVSSVVAAMAYRAGREAFRLPIGAAAALGGTVLLLPAVGPETFSTLTNVEWYCLAGVVVYLVAWFEGWQTNPLLTGFLLFVAATTTPLAILVGSFVVVRLVKEYLVERGAEGTESTADWRHPVRGSRALDFAVVFGLGAGIGVTVIGHLLAPPSAPVVGGTHVPRVTAMYAVRVVDNSVLGDRLITTTYYRLGETLSVTIGFMLLLALVVAAVLRGRRWTSLMLIGTSVLLFYVPALIRGLGTIGDLGFQPNGPGLGGRYLGVPALCLVMALLLLLRPSPPSEGLPPHGRLMAVATVAVAVMLVFNVPVDLLRQPLSAWELSVRQARTTCEAAHGQGNVVILNYPPGFGLRLTCHQAFGG